MDILILALSSIWLMGPGFIPNNVAAIIGGNIPVDRNKSWRGMRILGDGKTMRGSITGIIGGILTGLILNSLNPSVEPMTGVKLPHFSYSSMLGLSAGAIVGDAAGSLLKRRIGIKRGEFLPIVDQLDFLIGAVLITSLIAPKWSSMHLIPEKLIFLFVGTPVLHIGINKLDEKLEIT